MNDLNFELIPTKKADAPSFKINGITVHSVYDPVSEAQKWAGQIAGQIEGRSKPDKIIVFGLGAGYHIEALTFLLKKEENKIEIEVIEPSEESFRFIENNFNVSELLENVKLTIYKDDSKISEKLELDKSNIIFFCISQNFIAVYIGAAFRKDVNPAEF